MSLNRNLQRQLLMVAAQKYPAPLLEGEGVNLEDVATTKNLVYLEEHGLLRLVKSQYNDGTVSVGAVYATARGLDFIEEDGGLSAILGVVTVKLHDDTIKHLLEKQIWSSDMAEPEKKRWIDAVRELPAETTKHLVLKLVDMGLEQGPAAITAIGKLLGMG